MQAPVSNARCTDYFRLDGHAGVRTSEVLAQALIGQVLLYLEQNKCSKRAYVPGDRFVVDVIKKAFTSLDDLLCQKDSLYLLEGVTAPSAEDVMNTAAAFSGSCALMAIHDPNNGVLRVASTGDSRAVLGRWDAKAGQYVALPMSTDHTGFNQDEVQRVTREHPDEEGIIDPKTGRVFGLAVTRAFGDARWKWPNAITQAAASYLWGPSPRPNGVVKTPPYLTAEPEIAEVQLQTAEHPDFCIMATDGLWDNMSSEDAVMCVQMWLAKNQSTDFMISFPKDAQWDAPIDMEQDKQRIDFEPSFSTAEDLAKGDDDTYLDEDAEAHGCRGCERGDAFDQECAGWEAEGIVYERYDFAAAA